MPAHEALENLDPEVAEEVREAARLAREDN
jgi:hypothetical protein